MHVFKFKRLLFVFSIVSFAGIPSFAGGGVHIRNFGHSALLFRGGGESVLTNPFKSVGCAAGLKEPNLRAKVILASSELADEGARIAKGIFLVKPGSYRIGNLNIEGFTAPHDRVGGRRFGSATIWQWEQGGLRIAHLGGVAGPISQEHKVLLGGLDVLIISVGGGAKSYDGLEASLLIKELKPRHVIPVHYSKGRTFTDCDQDNIKLFLRYMKDYKVRNVGKTFQIKDKQFDETTINLMK
tara:strand:+ start:327 stop:1049 length:723 start_codon:yes stop_codon:yes gene_type:complete